MKLHVKQVYTLTGFSFTNTSGGTGLSNWEYNQQFVGHARVRVLKSWHDYEVGYRAIAEAVSPELKDYLRQVASPEDQRVFFTEHDITSAHNHRIQLKQLKPWTAQVTTVLSDGTVSHETVHHTPQQSQAFHPTSGESKIAPCTEPENTHILTPSSIAAAETTPALAISSISSTATKEAPKMTAATSANTKALARSTRRRFRRVKADLQAQFTGKSRAQVMTKKNIEQFGQDVLDRWFALIDKANAKAAAKTATPKATAKTAAPKAAKGKAGDSVKGAQKVQLKKAAKAAPKPETDDWDDEADEE